MFQCELVRYQSEGSEHPQIYWDSMACGAKIAKNESKKIKQRCIFPEIITVIQ